MIGPTFERRCTTSCMYMCMYTHVQSCVPVSCRVRVGSFFASGIYIHQEMSLVLWKGRGHIIYVYIIYIYIYMYYLYIDPVITSMQYACIYIYIYNMSAGLVGYVFNRCLEAVIGAARAESFQDRQCAFLHIATWCRPTYNPAGHMPQLPHRFRGGHGGFSDMPTLQVGHVWARP